jgi:hypothetical protein
MVSIHYLLPPITVPCYARALASASTKMRLVVIGCALLPPSLRVVFFSRDSGSSSHVASIRCASLTAQSTRLRRWEAAVLDAAGQSAS